VAFRSNSTVDSSIYLSDLRHPCMVRFHHRCRSWTWRL